MNIKTFGPVDERSLKQLERCMDAGDAEFGVLCADHHPGYSQPIGGAIAYEGYVSPSGVGYDIGCGNKAVVTELTRADLDALGGVERIMRRDHAPDLVRHGRSRAASAPTIRCSTRSATPSSRRSASSPRPPPDQLGTVGSGNHYVNLMEDEDGRVWVGVHFGSRGFGHKTASGLPRARAGAAVRRHARTRARWTRRRCCSSSAPSSASRTSRRWSSPASTPTPAATSSWPRCSRSSAPSAVHEVHNHHNFAWREEHGGRTYWVVRKGCTPARPGQEGFVGGSMGDESVILEGVESAEAEESLYSTVHGAGRMMSRTQAAGRVRRRKRWACAHRDCDRVFEIDGVSATNPADPTHPPVCPDHPDARVRKVWVEEQLKPGMVDWPAVQARLREQGIVLVGGGADEAPEVYKRLPDVLDAHAGSIRVTHTLRPLGVAMAGRDVFDPYKD